MRKNNNLNEGEFFEILNHEIRRKIIQLLYERIEMTYTELLKLLKIEDGLLNFHLKKLKKFLKKTERGGYVLSENGKLAYSIMHSVRRSLASAPPSFKSGLSKDILMRRILAFLTDSFIFFIFTGVFLDVQLWEILYKLSSHLRETINLHPWIFHAEHIPMIGEVMFRIVNAYAHIFFAVYIFITLLEAYKGQTPGKYLFKIRVVKSGGLKLGLVESGIRNAGKVFLLPLDLIVGIISFRRRGYIRFFDYYVDATIEKVLV